jgi:hypothetical protein
MKSPISLVIAATCAALLPALAKAAGAPAPARDCHVGVYRLASGRIVDVAPTDGEPLRWRAWDGATGLLKKTASGAWTSTYGWTGRPDGISVSFSACAEGRIQFGKMAGQRIPLQVTDTTFKGDGGVPLAGRLVLPKGVGRVPIVVLLHGAEHDSARDSYAFQRLFPAQGIGVFVYDKRGTGASGGAYSQAFDVLADDAVAALHEARRLAGPRAGRMGYQGGSQGGWVAPIAAAHAPVDFVIVSFGLAVTVIDEDQEEVALEMALKDHTPEETKKALEVADAAETVIASGFTEGFQHFDELRAKYKGEPWYKDLHGNYTWFLLPYSEAELREKAQAVNWGTPWRYDPMPTLAALKTPQLWVLGRDDLDAPSAETSRRLKGLIAKGRPITLAVYPGAEHGMTEFETAPDGERLSTRFCPGYFQMMADYIRKGRIGPAYGQSEITRPR